MLLSWLFNYVYSEGQSQTPFSKPASLNMDPVSPALRAVSFGRVAFFDDSCQLRNRVSWLSHAVTLYHPYNFVAEQGCRVRIWRDVRMRRRDGKTAGDNEDLTVEDDDPPLYRSLYCIGNRCTIPSSQERSPKTNLNKLTSHQPLTSPVAVKPHVVPDAPTQSTRSNEPHTSACHDIA